MLWRVTSEWVVCLDRIDRGGPKITKLNDEWVVWWRHYSHIHDSYQITDYARVSSPYEAIEIVSSRFWL